MNKNHLNPSWWAVPTLLDIYLALNYSPPEQLRQRKRRLMDERNFAGCVGFHSSTQPTDLSTIDDRLIKDLVR